MTRGGVRRALGALLVVAALGFLGAAVLRDLPAVLAYPWRARPGLLAASTLALTAVLAAGVGVWQLVLRGFGTRVRFFALCRVWFLSNLARYLPGKIWQFVGVAQLGASAGVPAAVGMTSLAAQMGFTLLAAGLVALLFLPASLFPTVPLPALRWTAPLALLLLHPGPIRAALRLAERLLRRPLASWEGSWGFAVGIVLLNAANWVAYGAALHLFIAALTPVGLERIGAITAMNALAFLAGYLVFVVPAGLGAKESVLAGLLASFLPGAVAAAIALAARLWTVAAELLPALLLVAGGRARSARWRRSGGTVTIAGRGGPSVPPP